MHLIHPALVHFSVALLILGGTVEASALLARRPQAARFGNVLVLAGTLSLLPTLVTGYLAANSLDVGAGARAVLDAHERNGLIVLSVFLFAMLWKGWFRGDLPAEHRPLYALVLLVGVGLTAYSAWLGGRLVYEYGIGVAAG